MSSSSPHPGSWDRGPPYPVVEQAATGEERCRCGGRFSAGDRCLRFAHTPSNLEPFLRVQTFCGVRCVRAFLLEALALLEGSMSTELLSDLHEVHASLQAVFAAIENDRLEKGFLAATGTK